MKNKFILLFLIIFVWSCNKKQILNVEDDVIISHLIKSNTKHLGNLKYLSSQDSVLYYEYYDRLNNFNELIRKSISDNQILNSNDFKNDFKDKITPHIEKLFSATIHDEPIFDSREITKEYCLKRINTKLDLRDFIIETLLIENDLLIYSITKPEEKFFRFDNIRVIAEPIDINNPNKVNIMFAAYNSTKSYQAYVCKDSLLKSNDIDTLEMVNGSVGCDLSKYKNGYIVIKDLKMQFLYCKKFKQFGL